MLQTRLTFYTNENYAVINDCIAFSALQTMCKPFYSVTGISWSNNFHLASLDSEAAE